MVEDPDRVAQPTRGIGREVLGAAGTVIAATVAKKLIDRAFSSRVYNRPETYLTAGQAHSVPV
jgi:hypothetical protein